MNESWLCDKGRFAFESLYSADRITGPQVRRRGRSRRCDLGRSAHQDDVCVQGVDRAGRGPDRDHRRSKALQRGRVRVGRASRETVLETNSVDAQLGDGLPAEVVFGLPSATIDDA